MKKEYELLLDIQDFKENFIQDFENREIKKIDKS
jgi:hypothetical protein